MSVVFKEPETFCPFPSFPSPTQRRTIFTSDPGVGVYCLLAYAISPLHLTTLTFASLLLQTSSWRLKLFVTHHFSIDLILEGN